MESFLRNPKLKLPPSGILTIEFFKSHLAFLLLFIRHQRVTGFETFAAGIGNNNTTYYCIFNQGTSEFEVGLGTLDATSANLTRGSGATIFSSSNSDNVVDFSAGTKDVFCTLPASKSVFLDASGTPVGAASAGFALAMAVAL